MDQTEKESDGEAGREGFVFLAGFQPGSRCWLQPFP